MSEAPKRKQRDIPKPLEICDNHRAIVNAEGSCLCAARDPANGSCAQEAESGSVDE